MEEEASLSGTFSTQAVLDVENPDQCQTSVKDKVTTQSIKNALAEVVESLKKGLAAINEHSKFTEAKRDSSAE